MLEFGDGTFYSRMWFISLGHLDFYGALCRPKGESIWKFIYRFRYDAEPGGEPECRNWFQVTLGPKTAVEVLGDVKLVVDALMMAMKAPRHELVLDTADADSIFQALGREKWAHISIERETSPVAQA